jgi:hypothetical protein
MPVVKDPMRFGKRLFAHPYGVPRDVYAPVIALIDGAVWMSEQVSVVAAKVQDSFPPPNGPAQLLIEVSELPQLGRNKRHGFISSEVSYRSDDELRQKRNLSQRQVDAKLTGQVFGLPASMLKVEL